MEEIISFLENEFIQNADENQASKMSVYMRNLFTFYGIKAPIRKKIYEPIIKKAKKEKCIQWDLLNAAFQKNEREWQYFVIDYLLALKDYLTWEDMVRITPFIKVKQWWDSIDALDELIGFLIRKYEVNQEYILSMAQDEDLWIRRIAIDHQLKFKEKTDAQLLGKIILFNLGSEEFFINKAIGWSLREYGKTNPDWVLEFVKNNEEKLSALSIREGTKYLSYLKKNPNKK